MQQNNNSKPIKKQPEIPIKGGLIQEVALGEMIAQQQLNESQVKKS